MAKNSQARIKANNKYNDKAYDRINIAVPKGHKTILQEIASRYGLSVNGYLNKLIDTAIEQGQATDQASPGDYGFSTPCDSDK